MYVCMHIHVNNTHVRLLVSNKNYACIQLLCTERSSPLKRFYRKLIDSIEEFTTGFANLTLVNSSENFLFISCCFVAANICTHRQINRQSCMYVCMYVYSYMPVCRYVYKKASMYVCMYVSKQYTCVHIFIQESANTY